jgi:flagellar biosynthesis anti-sigma factor FlgM
MRIDSNSRPQQDLGTTNLSDARIASDQGARFSAADTAAISPDQVRVQSLVAQVSAFPEIRQDRVDALSRSIREGSYQVSAEQTAAAILSEMAQAAAA